MEIRVIPASSTWPLRHALLRPRDREEDVRYRDDEDENALHLGAFIGATLVAVASFLPESFPERPGGYRVRGVAVNPAVARQDLGGALITSGIRQLDAREDARYVWANARQSAVPFYEALGFNAVSDEFVLPGLGPHRMVVRKLQPGSTEAE